MMIKQKIKIRYTNNKGAALLVVLFIVMAITILSLGFLSRSDVELACGENMILRTQMDYLAESGLEHAKGLILNPQDVDGEYWSGGTGQQIAAGSDYYNVSVARDDSDPTNRCNYNITCDAYRLRDGRKVGNSSLTAELRLDPCVALWMGNGATLSSSVVINGDVYCNGALRNKGQIDGDVFAATISGAGSISGQRKAAGDLSLARPLVTTEDFILHYAVQPVAASLFGQTFGPYDPVRICYNSGDVQLAGNVRIEGMLMVGGDLRVQGTGNVINAGKNLPAIFVKGNMVMENGCGLDVSGLVVVDGQVLIGAGNAGVNILGGLFAAGGLVETTADSSGNGHFGVLYNGPTWRPGSGYIGGAVDFDGVDDKIEDTSAGSYLNGLSAITVCVWVKSDITKQDRGIFFTRNPSGNDEELGVRYNRNGALSGGASIIKASIRTTSGYTQIESPASIQTTNWQHLALVWESGSSLKLYVDGQLKPNAYDRGPVFGTIVGVEKLMLGQGTKGMYWEGLLDDLRIYNRGLSAAEINTIKAGGAVPGLVGHWRLDEDGGSVTITAAPEKTAIVVWSQTGAEQKWGSAAGAFFRSIKRK